MQTLPDEELVKRCKVELPDNTRSYEALVQRHSPVVYSLIYRLIGNREEAEDLTQEVFIKVYNNLKKFEEQSSFSSWLYRIATNSALDGLEKLKRRPQRSHLSSLGNSTNRSAEEEEWYNFQAASIHNPEEAITLAELRNCIGEVFNKLDREQANVLIMRDVNDLSYDDIATTTGTKLSAIKMRIYRARLAFQELFKKICDHDPVEPIQLTKLKSLKQSSTEVAH